MLEAGDSAVMDFDEDGSLWTRLSRVPALKIAGIDDVRVLSEHGMGVDVA